MELVEQLILLKRLSSYGLVGEIIIVIGLLIIFIYQKRQIGSLETQIKSQKGILESAETFLKLFDLEKLKGFGEILEKKVRTEKEIEIKEIKEDYFETIKKYEDIKWKMEFVVGEFIPLLDAFYDAFYLLPDYFRKEVIDHMGEGKVKEGLKKANKKLEEIDNEVRKKAISEAFGKSGWRQAIGLMKNSGR